MASCLPRTELTPLGPQLPSGWASGVHSPGPGWASRLGSLLLLAGPLAPGPHPVVGVGLAVALGVSVLPLEAAGWQQRSPLAVASASAARVGPACGSRSHVGGGEDSLGPKERWQQGSLTSPGHSSAPRSSAGSYFPARAGVPKGIQAQPPGEYWTLWGDVDLHPREAQPSRWLVKSVAAQGEVGLGELWVGPRWLTESVTWGPEARGVWGLAPVYRVHSRAGISWVGGEPQKPRRIGAQVPGPHQHAAGPWEDPSTEWRPGEGRPLQVAPWTLSLTEFGAGSRREGRNSPDPVGLDLGGSMLGGPRRLPETGPLVPLVLRTLEKQLRHMRGLGNTPTHRQFKAEPTVLRG